MSQDPNGIAFSLFAHDVEHRVNEFRTLRSSEWFRRGGGKEVNARQANIRCALVPEQSTVTDVAVN